MRVNRSRGGNDINLPPVWISFQNRAGRGETSFVVSDQPQFRQETLEVWRVQARAGDDASFLVRGLGGPGAAIGDTMSLTSHRISHRSRCELAKRPGLPYRPRESSPGTSLPAGQLSPGCARPTQVRQPRSPRRWYWLPPP